MNRTLEYKLKRLRQAHAADTTWGSALRLLGHNFQRGIISLGILLILTLAACNGSPAISTPQTTRYPTPTSHGLFSDKAGQGSTETSHQLTTTPTVAVFFQEYQTATPQPTRTPTPTSPPSINQFIHFYLPSFV